MAWIESIINSVLLVVCLGYLQIRVSWSNLKAMNFSASDRIVIVIGITCSYFRNRQTALGRVIIYQIGLRLFKENNLKFSGDKAGIFMKLPPEILSVAHL